MDRTGFPNPLPPVEEHRAWKDRLATWAAYAAAAGATMAAAGNAEADIIYVHPTNPIELKLPGAAPYTRSTRVSAPVAIDGISFTVNLAYYPGRASYAGVHGGGMNWFSSSGILVDFAPGHAIGGSNMQTGPGFFYSSAGRAYPQHFPLNQTGFAGFQLPSSDGGGMGWMRAELVDRDANGKADELEIIDWAYNNAGGPISAGQEVSTVPEPGSTALALFALGAPGLLAWRRRRAAAK